MAEHKVFTAADAARADAPTLRDEWLYQQRRAAKAEDEFWLHLRTIGQQDRWKRQHQFHSTRKWAFDMARPDIKLAVEIEGAIRGVAGAPLQGQMLCGIDVDSSRFASVLAPFGAVASFPARGRQTGDGPLFEQAP